MSLTLKARKRTSEYVIPESREAREREPKSIKKLFGFPVKEQFEVITEKTPLVPEKNPHFMFPEKQTRELLMFLRRKRNNSVYIFGPPGTGKTQLVMNVAAQLNWPLLPVNGDSFMTRQQLIGKTAAKAGETFFQYEAVPLAMKMGAILLINEYDTLNPLATNILKPVVEADPYLVIAENNAEVVSGGDVHADFRIVVTANTAGRGDETGQYVNTHTQSTADLRRFAGFIQMDFLKKEKEVEILCGQFGEELEKPEAEMFCDVAQKMRNAWQSGKMDRSFGTAELINWVEAYVDLSDAHDAAAVAFLNSYPSDLQIAVNEMISAAFGKGR